jgi:hypothetical protein
MPRFRRTIPVDDYVLDVLMPDLVGHDHQPAAFLVYLFLYRQAERQRWRRISFSIRDIAEGTGLSKSAVQTAILNLRRRQLIKSRSRYSTATPEYQIMRHWRERGIGC